MSEERVEKLQAIIEDELTRLLRRLFAIEKCDPAEAVMVATAVYAAVIGASEYIQGRPVEDDVILRGIRSFIDGPFQSRIAAYKKVASGATNTN